MVHCGSLMKSTLVAVVLMAVIHSGSAAEKLASCCKTVTSQKINEPITGYMVQKPNPPCVPAVIFQTEKGLFCSQITARWVKAKILAFQRNKVQTRTVVPSSTTSLLSIITSTASPPSPHSSSSSSSSLPPLSSTSWTPADETLSENSDE